MNTEPHRVLNGSPVTVSELVSPAWAMAFVLDRHDNHQHRTEDTAAAWMASADPGGEIRDGAWVTELAGDCLTG
ncbi:hypothetical protein SNE510_53880 [Streptomyces sp. NE5-10]|uniref:hypothetical protein n=1 Tax=Streptomyces sp. NE5-10 TaxID=2759674 RepID=UPI00190532F9|nr:hypothetical protein [Streptomyces sp. NE5-10]GHJ95869.1 hypothetical protein SNE510_53880 [Streptomyces sp. NE5-10]